MKNDTFQSSIEPQVDVMSNLVARRRGINLLLALSRLINCNSIRKSDIVVASKYGCPITRSQLLFAIRVLRGCKSDDNNILVDQQAVMLGDFLDALGKSESASRLSRAKDALLTEPLFNNNK